MEKPLPSFISKHVTKGEYFFLNLFPDPEMDLSVICGGVERFDENYFLRRTSFNYYGLEYIASGQCEVKIGDETRTASPGAVICYTPNNEVQMRKSGDEPLMKYFIDFTGTEAQQMVSELMTKSPVMYHAWEYPWVKENIRQIIEIGKIGNEDSSSICKLLLQVVFSQLVSQKYNEPLVVSSAFMKYREAQRLINEKFAELRSLSDLAKACHVSSPYLCRIYRKYHHESPLNALNNHKLDEAANLLLAGNHIVKEVSDLVGYEDPLYFSRVFKKRFGLSPKRFAEHAQR